MGLLNRRGRAPARGTGAPTAAPDPAAQAPAAGDRPVLTAADLAAPAWTTLPPIPPTLSPMTLTAARDFEHDLVARQRLDLKLAPLGHALSESAPAGVVEVVSVIATEAPALGDGGAVADPRLDLAVPPAPSPEGTTPTGPARRRSGRAPSPSAPPSRPSGATRPTTQPAPAPPTQPAPPLPLAADVGAPPAAPVPAPAPAASPVTPPAPPVAAGPAPVTEAAAVDPPAPAATVPLASQQPIVPVEPLASPAAAATPGAVPAAPALPLVRATMPPNLPVVALPGTRLPEGQRAGGAPAGLAAVTAGVPASPNPPAGSAPAPTSSTGLVGEQPLAPPAGPSPAADPQATLPPPAPPGDAVLPLAERNRPEPNQVEPHRTMPAPAAPPPPVADTPAVVPEPPSAPAPAGPPGREAPLVGSQPLIDPAAAPRPVTESGAEAPSPELPVARPDQPGASTTDRPRRTGLGAPLAGLPPTARSFDPTKQPPASPRQPLGAPARRPAPVAPAPPTAPPALSGAPLPLASWSAAGPALAGRSGLTAPTPPPARRSPVTWGSLPELPVAGLEPLTAPAAPAPEAPLAVRPLTPFQPFIPDPAGEPAPAAAPPAEGGPVGSLSASAAPALAPTRPGRALAAPPPAPSEGSAVRLSVGQRHGVDLRHVPVDRSVAGAAQASRIGARAYTSEQGVVIPPQVGTLDAGEGRALLAHELTHVAQRSRLGAAMPPEHTPAGQTLEAQAQTAELALAPVPPPASPPTPAGARGAAAAPAAGPLALAAPPPAKAAPLDETSLLAAMQKLSDRMGTSSPPAGQPQTVVMTPPAPVAAAGVQRAPVRDMISQVEARGAAKGPSDPREASVFAKKPSDADLSRLARWLYPLISYRLKGELREDRERAGLLTDTYRRW